VHPVFGCVTLRDGTTVSTGGTEPLSLGRGQPMRRLVASAAIVAIASVSLLVLAGPAFAGNNQGENYNTHGQNANDQGRPSPCQDSGQQFIGDGRLTGEINTLNNFTRYISTNGTCGGGVNGIFTVVSAPTVLLAAQECAVLGLSVSENLRNGL